MEFAYPFVLLAVLAILPIAWLATRRKPASIPLPSLTGLQPVRPTFRLRLLWLPIALRALAVAALVVAVAGPRTVEAETIVPAEGIDIVLTLDTSGSMVNNNLTGGVSRYEASLEVIREFIDSRENDRIGFVVFSEFAIALSPPTLDHDALQELVTASEEFQFFNSTAIGLGLSTSTSLLRDSSSASRIVILLTDGMDNVEEAIRPLESARIAETLGVRVYTIGIVDPQNPTGVDTETLQAISERTGAESYEARTSEDLADVYEEISRLETSGVERDRFISYTEYGPWFALAAVGLIFSDLLLRTTWLRRTTG